MLTRVLLLTVAGLLMAGSASADWKSWASEREPAPERVKVSEETVTKYGWELEYADGSGKLSFRDLAESGQPFVLMWWLSDCPVCHMQLPYVQKLQKDIEDNQLDIRVVSICIDQDSKDCLKYVRDKGVTFDVLHDPRGRKTDQKYRVKDLGTPVTYVFGAGAILKGTLSGFKQQYSRAVLSQLGITLPAAP